MKIGDRIRADAHHWLRPNELGTVMVLDYKRGEHSAYIKFDENKPGRGINDSELWMNPRELVIEGVAKRKVD